MNHVIADLISKESQIKIHQVKSVLSLFDEGATIPFIARYRKEKTGSLDEVEISKIKSLYDKFSDLEDRKKTILKAIEEQDALTDQLKNRIINCYDPTELEDIYLPFKRKRKTKAGVARELGLEPLAMFIMNQKNGNIFQEAKKYFSDKIKTADDAIAGASHIIAEIISENQKLREKTRSSMVKYGTIASKVIAKKKVEAIKFKDYFDFDEKLSRCPSHRLLAILRGHKEGFLRISMDMDHERIHEGIFRRYISFGQPHAPILKAAIEDGYKRLVLPSIENQVLAFYKEKADAVAIEVFVKNLKQLLLSAPLGQKITLGIDPGFRTGCKVVVLDKNGNLLTNTTIYPHPPQSKYEESKKTIAHLIQKYNIEAISIGNGTAGRETESFIKSLDSGKDIFLINEDGASIYSASEIARNEFPDQDITVRGAVSIGRRLMDPLAELVKIDPKSIGVGQYQHDVNQPMLKKSLDETVMSCVNAVGVNINTATQHLLTYVSGLGPVTASNIVAYRKENGNFTSKNALKKVPRIGAKAFEQAAGFLRIRKAKNPLDNTGVHPESYPIVKKMAADLGSSISDLVQDANLIKQIDLKRYITNTVGIPTLQDITKELLKPGLDPRGEISKFEFDGRIRTIEDLREGMILPGIVTNVTNFGAFIDIGIKEGGLVHISQITNRFISDPSEVLSINQKVNVKVMQIDTDRKRIALSMKDI